MIYCNVVCCSVINTGFDEGADVLLESCSSQTNQMAEVREKKTNQTRKFSSSRLNVSEMFSEWYVLFTFKVVEIMNINILIIAFWF